MTICRHNLKHSQGRGERGTSKITIHNILVRLCWRAFQRISNQPQWLIVYDPVSILESAWRKQQAIKTSNQSNKCSSLISWLLTTFKCQVHYMLSEFRTMFKKLKVWKEWTGKTQVQKILKKKLKDQNSEFLENSQKLNSVTRFTSTKFFFWVKPSQPGNLKAKPLEVHRELQGQEKNIPFSLPQA